MREKIGVKYRTVENEIEDCSFCIIETQQKQIVKLKKELEHANQLANCV